MIEFDELCLRQSPPLWLWVGVSRQTRQVLGVALGDRSETTCALLWKHVQKDYKKALLYSDLWEAYQAVLPDEQHEAMGKGAGQTCHIERFNNILRQRLGRFVRRTLSFSKCDRMHEMCLSLFLHEHNTNCRY